MPSWALITLRSFLQKTFSRGKEDIADKKEIDKGQVGADESVGATYFLENLYEEDVLDPTYHAKTLVLNHAVQEIGMGRYQYMLLLVAGFGWFADSVWPLITGLILSPVVDEFHFNAPFLSLAANAGLLVGAVFWGIGCDILGRQWSFNITLLIAGAFGLAAGGSPNFMTLAVLLAVLGIGVGGNLPVDSAVFLDLVPASHQYLLTFMSIFWCLGQLLVNLLAWPLIANFSCQGTETCQRGNNMGWRYLLFSLGGITLVMWGVRLFLFDLVESPRYLIAKGNDPEAVAVIQKIAAYNNRSTSLTVEQLTSIRVVNDIQQTRTLRTTYEMMDHIKSLFMTKKLAYSTSLLIIIWGTIGLASTLYNNFLPFLLASHGAHFGDATLTITYRNTFILSVIGVPAAFAATWMVELPFLGRRGALSAASGLTGAFLYATTTSRSSNALLGWNCGYTFFSNIMYGVLYAISSEIFPAKDRGTGNGLVFASTRIFGLIAPIIALYANLQTSAPVYISGSLIIFAGLLTLLLPYEPRGKASM